MNNVKILSYYQGY